MVGSTPGGGVGQTITRVALGGFVGYAGVGHLSFARRAFQAQVPSWVPVDPDLVVVASGVVEIALGAALVAAPASLRPQVGLASAAFFLAVFPGNIAQFVEHRDAFGLDTDLKRGLRLLGQPALIGAALWSTGALATLTGSDDD